VSQAQSTSTLLSWCFVSDLALGLRLTHERLTCMAPVSCAKIPGPCSRDPLRCWGATMEWILSRRLRIDEELCETTVLAKSSNVSRSTRHLPSSVSLSYPRWMYLWDVRHICNAVLIPLFSVIFLSLRPNAVVTP
jgi:hypothetical protein